MLDGLTIICINSLRPVEVQAFWFHDVSSVQHLGRSTVIYCHLRLLQEIVNFLVSFFDALSQHFFSFDLVSLICLLLLLLDRVDSQGRRCPQQLAGLFLHDARFLCAKLLLGLGSGLELVGVYETQFFYCEGYDTTTDLNCSCLINLEIDCRISQNQGSKL